MVWYMLNQVAETCHNVHPAGPRSADAVDCKLLNSVN